MNLDLDMLKEMISSTLQEIYEPNEPAATTDKEEEVVKAAEDALEAAEDAEEEAKKEQSSEAENAAMADMVKTPGTVSESFEITKGRLRQIIAEELISAKKQGIL
jgi:FKBP-type peptidyl-prolyl cis-trans isomerase